MVFSSSSLPSIFSTFPSTFHLFFWLLLCLVVSHLSAAYFNHFLNITPALPLGESGHVFRRHFLTMLIFVLAVASYSPPILRVIDERWFLCLSLMVCNSLRYISGGLPPLSLGTNSRNPACSCGLPGMWSPGRGRHLAETWTQTRP